MSDKDSMNDDADSTRDDVHPHRFDDLAKLLGDVDPIAQLEHLIGGTSTPPIDVARDARKHVGDVIAPVYENPSRDVFDHMASGFELSMRGNTDNSPLGPGGELRGVGHSLDVLKDRRGGSWLVLTVFDYIDPDPNTHDTMRTAVVSLDKIAHNAWHALDGTRCTVRGTGRVMLPGDVTPRDGTGSTAVEHMRIARRAAIDALQRVKAKLDVEIGEFATDGERELAGIVVSLSESLGEIGEAIGRAIEITDRTLGGLKP
jgi:hypothetical protein